MDEFDTPSPDARIWYVLHVKPRTEKKVAWYLGRYKCFHHLPVRIVVHKVQRRKVRRELPLFPGYVFAHLSPAECTDILRSNLVVRTILGPFPRETVRQLRQIARAARSAPDIRPLKQTFKEGERVLVKYGPLRGTTGYVQRDEGRATLCINVDILGSAVAVSVSPGDIEKLDE